MPPLEFFAAYQGQQQAERGFQCLKNPELLASARDLKNAERLMALWMVMTVCWLGSAALEYRLRTALRDHEATLPDQQGKRLHHPTARWGLHYFVGMHWLCQAGRWPIVLTLTAEHQHLLRLLGQPSMRRDEVG